MQRTFPEPARPVAVFGVHRAIPIRDKPARAQCNDIHKTVLSVVLRDQFGENLAAAVPRIRPVKLVVEMKMTLSMPADAAASKTSKVPRIEVEKIVGVFFAAVFVDAVPGGDVDDTVATAKYLRQRRAVQNGPFDEPGSLVQRRRPSNVENDRRVTFVEQLGYEGLPEISRSPG